MSGQQYEQRAAQEPGRLGRETAEAEGGAAGRAGQGGKPSEHSAGVPREAAAGGGAGCATSCRPLPPEVAPLCLFFQAPP